MEQAEFSNQHWWVRRGEVTRGPFAPERIQRYLDERRITMTDTLSPDNKLFKPVAEWPAFSEVIDLGRSERETRQAHRRAVPLARPAVAEDLSVDLDAERAARHRLGDDAGMDLASKRPRTSVDFGREPLSGPGALAARASAGRQSVATATRPTHGFWRGLIILMLSGALGYSALKLLRAPPAVRTVQLDATRCMQAPEAGVDLARCDLSSSVLAGRDLAGITLRGANLRAARLDGTRLQDADLSYADLTSASLVDAECAGARLVGAELAGAQLARANFSGADLRYANLQGANLDGADFSGARLGRATLPDGRVCAEGAGDLCRSD